jgi:UDPglucose 6-dehydrogenase
MFDIVFVPEFLTEKRANLDMYEAKFALIGTHDGVAVPDIVSLFKLIYNHNCELEVFTKKFEVCELFKYTVNMFLAVKVWYFNEVYEISDKLGFDYNELRDILHLDPRIGESHTQVPGHDGRFGFGLGCLPKEIMAGSFLQTQLGIPNTVLQEIINRNKTFREKPIQECELQQEMQHEYFHFMGDGVTKCYNKSDDLYCPVCGSKT